MEASKKYSTKLSFFFSFHLLHKIDEFGYTIFQFRD